MAKQQRRGKYQIWAEILEECLWSPHTQTRLLHTINLTTAHIKTALTYLVGRGLLEKIVDEEDSSTYRTTMNGKEALTRYYELVNEYFG
ncbi:MAG: winged helix-turn-helix domain-containing protein [Promethearchaeota archaeon]